MVASFFWFLLEKRRVVDLQIMRKEGGKNCSTFSTYTKTRTNAWKIAKVRQNDDCAAPKGSPLDIKTHQNIKRKTYRKI